MDGIRNYPYGGNMAFNRRVVDRIGFFNPNVGRKGTGKKRSELFKGAETEYCHRLAKAGGRFFYEPDAIVQHRVLPSQLRKSYFRTIHFNAGCQYGIFDSTRYHRNFFGIPLFLFPQTARAIGRYFHQLVRRGTDYAFRQEMTVCHFCGLISGYVSRHRKK
jgi:GT2 family glycosyltransferase